MAWLDLNVSSHDDFIKSKYFQRYHDDVIKLKHLRVTGHLCGEFTGHRWIPCIKASDADCRWSAPEQTAEQTVETPAIGDDIALIITSL